MKKKSIVFSMRLSAELYKKLEDAGWSNRLKKSQIINLSLQSYLEFLEKKQLKKV